MAPPTEPTPGAGSHAFERRPHRTLLGLVVPVLGSLVAEPVTGLVDTVFVARLGAVPLAALGVGAVVLSALFAVFNFLGIGTQTAVGNADGRGDRTRIGELHALAVALAVAFGLAMIVVGTPLAGRLAGWMGADGAVQAPAALYLRIRLLGAPAVLVAVAAFGTLRGLQDMRTPLAVAAGINLVNVVLDPLLIFGLGHVPAMGIAGAAWASVGAQWLGAAWVLVAAARRVPPAPRPRWRSAVALVRVGGDLFLRTGALMLFILLTTRAATRIGAEAGAAHQAVRQVWSTTAFFLDAFAIAGQTLVAFFLGAGRVAVARRVAALVCGWSVATGAVLGLAMVVATPWAAALLVPATAHGLFRHAWWIAAASQPLAGLSFGTDGVHWGTGDFAYLRNAVVAATALGAAAILLLDESSPGALAAVWWVTALWVTIRAACGLVRIWPGVGRAPLGRAPAQS